MATINEKSVLTFVSAQPTEQHNSISRIVIADHLAPETYDFNCEKLAKAGTKLLETVDKDGNNIDAYGRVTYEDGTVAEFPAIFAISNSFTDATIKIYRSEDAKKWAGLGAAKSTQSYKFVKSQEQLDAEHALLATKFYNWITSNTTAKLPDTLLPKLWAAYTAVGGELFADNGNVLVSMIVGSDVAPATIEGWEQQVTELPGHRQCITYTAPIKEAA